MKSPHFPAETKASYRLIDFGGERKLEAWAGYRISRPAPAAQGPPALSHEIWDAAEAVYLPGKGWEIRKAPPNPWFSTWNGRRFALRLAQGGQLGVFPEQAALWERLELILRNCPTAPTNRRIKILNLFAYTGAATLVMAGLPNIEVTHVDGSRSAVGWARQNALANALDPTDVRWVEEDVQRYVQRLGQREERFDGILLDPPSFGRGPGGKRIWKIDDHLEGLLAALPTILADPPLFLLVSAHSPGWSAGRVAEGIAPWVTRHGGAVESGRLALATDSGRSLASGEFAFWRRGAIP